MSHRGRAWPGPAPPVPRAAGWLGLLAVVAVPLGWQAREAPRYAGALLACAVFRESVESRIDSRSGSAERIDAAGRDGVLVLRSAPVSGGLEIEAWYDSLEVWRDTQDGTERADTDGFVGGRFRGVLSPTGGYRATVRPFVPDDLAALADLSRVLDDFLPPVAPMPLAPGARWSDGPGLVVERLSDERLAGGDVAARFRWTRTSRPREIRSADSAAVRMEQAQEEEGEVAWLEGRGPLSWRRTVTVRVSVPAQPGVPAAIASVVTQRIRVVRDESRSRCPPA